MAARPPRACYEDQIVSYTSGGRGADRNPEWLPQSRTNVGLGKNSHQNSTCNEPR
jgi:hypothetical protein